MSVKINWQNNRQKCWEMNDIKKLKFIGSRASRERVDYLYLLPPKYFVEKLFRPFLLCLDLFLFTWSSHYVNQPIFREFTEENNKLMTHTYTKNLLIEI